MIVEFDDKIRYVDLDINPVRGEAPFVHTIEIGADFTTFYVKTPHPDQSAWIEGLGIDFAEHDNERFHAEDHNMAWVFSCFGEPRWRTPFHVIGQDILDRLSISDNLKRLL